MPGPAGPGRAPDPDRPGSDATVRAKAQRHHMIMIHCDQVPRANNVFDSPT